MADSGDRSQRAAALEEKRRKIEEMRQRRAMRGGTDSATTSARPANLDEYIDGLLQQPSPMVASSAPEEVDAKAPERADSADLPANGAAPNPTVGAPDYVISDAQQDPANNVIAESVIGTVKPAAETITVSTQTDAADFPTENEVDEDGGEDDATVDLPRKKDMPNGVTKFDETDHVSQQTYEPQVLSDDQVQREVTTHKQHFSAFINRSSKKVERWLGSSMEELLVDAVDEQGDEETKLARQRARSTQSGLLASQYVSSHQVFSCAPWTTGRVVTDLDWSLLQRDLFLSTYTASGASNTGDTASTATTSLPAAAPQRTAPSESLTPRSGELLSDGLLALWSLQLPQRPEHLLTCGSSVTVGRFHPTDDKAIVGGCENGQLVVWDVRTGRLPVQKSTLTALAGAAATNSRKCHVQSINSMHVLADGTSLVTSSTDGRINFWSLSNLSEPVESINSIETLSCMALAPESESLLVGNDFGQLHAVTQQRNRRQVRQLQTAPPPPPPATAQIDSADGPTTADEQLGHYGTITAVACKTVKVGSYSSSSGLRGPASGTASKGFLTGSAGLTLTSGVDWTVKLWSPATTDLPLLSMVSHSYDAVADVQWCPTHPALFGSVSANGALSLWNLNISMDEPLTGPEGISLPSDSSVIAPNDSGAGGNLSKLRWSADGRRAIVAAGESVHLLSWTEDLLQMSSDEDIRLMNNLMARSSQLESTKDGTGKT